MYSLYLPPHTFESHQQIHRNMETILNPNNFAKNALFKSYGVIY